MPLDLDEIRARWTSHAHDLSCSRHPDECRCEPHISDPDIAALLSEVARLTSELAAAQAGPVVEWHGKKYLTAHAGLLRLLLSPAGWAVVLPIPDSQTIITLVHGPETGDAGKAACIAAYRRACGLSPG